MLTGNPEKEEKLVADKNTLEYANEKIKALKDFHIIMKRDWSTPKDRIIGHVVWALPITGNTPPHGYTQDVCVIKLDKERFMQNFLENVIDLGACRVRLTRGI